MGVSAVGEYRLERGLYFFPNCSISFFKRE
jgi:hypothetical protein